mmetsp:Transcript_24968/g.66100  ORF Transcript_24968/g.66100 Transcript_24968/m.66100 type:complete len:208 (+) Transcript_24968:284-907(+)
MCVRFRPRRSGRLLGGPGLPTLIEDHADASTPKLVILQQDVEVPLHELYPGVVGLRGVHHEDDDVDLNGVVERAPSPLHRLRARDLPDAVLEAFVELLIVVARVLSFPVNHLPHLQHVFLNVLPVVPEFQPVQQSGLPSTIEAQDEKLRYLRAAACTSVDEAGQDHHLQNLGARTLCSQIGSQGSVPIAARSRHTSARAPRARGPDA